MFFPGYYIVTDELLSWALTCFPNYTAHLTMEMLGIGAYNYVNFKSHLSALLCFYGVITVLEKQINDKL